MTIIIIVMTFNGEPGGGAVQGFIYTAKVICPFEIGSRELP